MMKMRVSDAQVLIQQESVSLSVGMVITERRERNSVVHAPQAALRAWTHQKPARVAIPRSIVKVELMITLFTSLHI